MQPVVRIAIFAALGVVIHFGGCGRPAASSPRPAVNKQIVILAPRQTSFWEAVKTGMEQAGKDLDLASAAVGVALQTGDGTPRFQLAQLKQIASRSDVVGVAISPVDATDQELVAELGKLGSRGIAVVTVDSDVDRQQFRSCRAAYVGMDNLAAGNALGKALADMVPQGGGYALFTGNPRAQRNTDRVKGIAQGAGDRWECIRTIDDNFDLILVRSQVREMMRLFPMGPRLDKPGEAATAGRPAGKEEGLGAARSNRRLTALLALEAGSSVAVASAVRELGNRPYVKILAGDIELRSIEPIDQGFFDAWLVQEPYETGYQAVRLLRALAGKDEAQIRQILPRWGQSDGDLLHTGFRLARRKEPMLPNK